MSPDKITELLDKAREVPLAPDAFAKVRYHAIDDATLAELVRLVRTETIRECADIARHYAFALDGGGNEYVRSRECQQTASAILALLERDE